MERLTVLGMFTLALAGVAWNGLARAGLRFNVDKSMPLGAYWFHPGPVARGDIVQSCLPDPLAQYAVRRQYLVTGGSCPDGVIPVVKVLAATSSDRIVIAESGVTIDGKPWPMSALRRVDTSGRPMPRHVGRVLCDPESDFLMGEHPRSWDSRYLGCVPRSTIAGRWEPIPFTGWVTAFLISLSQKDDLT